MLGVEIPDGFVEAYVGKEEDICHCVSGWPLTMARRGAGKNSPSMAAFIDEVYIQ